MILISPRQYHRWVVCDDLMRFAEQRQPHPLLYLWDWCRARRAKGLTSEDVYSGIDRSEAVAGGWRVA